MSASEWLRLLENHVWQSTVCFPVAAALAWWLRRAPARARFAIWSAASLKWLVPLAGLRALGALVPWRHAALAAPPFAVAFMAQPFAAAPALPAPGPLPLAQLHPWAAALVGVWLAGGALVAGMWARRWLRMARLVRAAQPLSDLPVRAVQSPEVLEPGVFGLFRPVLVLPAGFAAHAAAAHFAAVLAHEQCHVRRRDNLWAMLHMGVEAAFWFHPFVWWTGRRLLETRELACDEAVLAGGGDAVAYVQGLLRACRQAARSPLPCVAGVAGGNLKRRIAAICSDGFGRRGLAWPARAALLALAAAVIAAPVAAGLGHGASAQQPAPLSFEVATLRLDTANGGVMGGCRGVDSPPEVDPQISVPLGRCVIVAGRLSHMMSIAYDIPMQRISGFPDWDGPSRWDVEAEVENPRSATEAQLRGLLQNFLVQQFKLKLRRSTKVAATYLLVVNKAAKLKPSQQQSMTMQPEANGRLALQGCSMRDLADFLSQLPSVGRPVVDHTHLPGRYDFTLDILGSQPQGPGDFKRGLANWQSVFQDLKDQLGLKLEAGRSPVETIVIESAARPQGCPCSQQ